MRGNMTSETIRSRAKQTNVQSLRHNDTWLIGIVFIQRNFGGETALSTALSLGKTREVRNNIQVAGIRGVVTEICSLGTSALALETRTRL